MNRARISNYIYLKVINTVSFRYGFSFLISFIRSIFTNHHSVSYSPILFLWAISSIRMSIITSIIPFRRLVSASNDSPMSLLPAFNSGYVRSFQWRHTKPFYNNITCYVSLIHWANDKDFIIDHRNIWTRLKCQSIGQTVQAQLSQLYDQLIGRPPI